MPLSSHSFASAVTTKPLQIDFTALRQRTNGEELVQIGQFAMDTVVRIETGRGTLGTSCNRA
ncbi:MAG: hypothetical protein ACPGPS_13985, partial [Rubripirellula sp.]